MKLKVGQTVKLIGKHPFAGHTGEVVAIQPVLGKNRPRIRIHDMNDHEVFVMDESDVKVLK